MMISVGNIGVVGAAARWRSGRDPLLRLFANGESGFLFSGFPATGLFEDVAGATPVDANDDPVARVNDQSGTGNDALQSTNTRRPLWKTNSGKPYLQGDATDDILVTPFVPTANLTLAAAVRFGSTVGTQVAIGGGTSSTNKRAGLGVSGAGLLSYGWGNDFVGGVTYGSDLRGTDHVALITGDGLTRAIWLDGVLVNESAISGSPDGTSPLGILGDNLNGAPTRYLTGRLYAALALNRRVTTAEIATITHRFRSTYQ
jgi:hypothetical protein